MGHQISFRVIALHRGAIVMYRKKGHAFTTVTGNLRDIVYLLIFINCIFKNTIYKVFGEICDGSFKLYYL